eukprot:TRINITY_DN2413_c0_g1_i1.p1 TRINITY_DN2413_c0_g1~~TRINITY_DN2413_c0_g1_i1.p1  ORF type:complete len:147 (-),score=29.97 TRINITY_DN2413_c0_g1_i1:93-533(-)
MRAVQLLLCTLLFVSFAWADDCPVQCADGSFPIQRGIPPHINGCGPESPLFKLIPNIISQGPFYPCCATHDACYGTAGTVRDQCDDALISCMGQVCSRMSWFKRGVCMASRYTIAKMIHTDLACSVFEDSQVRVGCPEGDAGLVPN